MKNEDSASLGDGHKFDLKSDFKASWKATNDPFVVADLEVTGLDNQADEILEFSAVLAAPSGAILSEFSALVRVTQPMSHHMQELTGITEDEIERNGRPLPEVMKAFLAFVGSRPVFIHNAPFDNAFLIKAGQLTHQPFDNDVHDTLEISRRTWPTLRSHSLRALTEHLKLAKTGERCLDDAKNILIILLAAREKALSKAI